MLFVLGISHALLLCFESVDQPLRIKGETMTRHAEKHEDVAKEVAKTKEDAAKDAASELQEKTQAADKKLAAERRGLTREHVDAMEAQKMASANPQDNPVSLSQEDAQRLGRLPGLVTGDPTRPNLAHAPLHNPGVVLEPDQVDPSPNTTPDRPVATRNPTDPSRQVDPPRQASTAMASEKQKRGTGDASSKPEDERDPSDPSRKADRG